MAGRIPHVIFVAAIGLGIEVRLTLGQIQRQPPIRAGRQPHGDRLGLIAHLVAVQMLDLRAQEPEQHERQEDRGDRHRHDMQQHDA